MPSLALGLALRINDPVQLRPSPLDVTEVDVDAGNAELEPASAEARVAWALERFRPHIVLSSSFGAQAAVLLHMVTRQWPEIPVVVVDTGYLFSETYRFVDELTQRLSLNLDVYRAELKIGRAHV